MALKKSQRSIREWTKQKWRTRSGKPSKETGEAYAPDRAIVELEKTAKGRSRLARASSQVRADRKKDPKSVTRHGLHKGKSYTRTA